MLYAILTILLWTNFVHSAEFEDPKNDVRRFKRSQVYNDQDTVWTPDSLDCSNVAPVNNTYCDRIIDSLLVFVVGFPDNDVKSNASSSSSKYYDTPSKKYYSPQQDPTVTKICCFLLSFPTMRDVCCRQVSAFCDGIPGQRDACTCQGTSKQGGGSSSGWSTIEINGGSSNGGNGGDSNDGISVSQVLHNAYNILKKIGTEVIENFMNNKK